MTKTETLPFDVTLQVRDSCLCMQLQRAARMTARLFDDAFRPLGLTNGQFSILMALNQPQAPTIGRVAEILAMDRTTLTANLKPLERRGLVAVSVDEQDKRSRRLRLTDAGNALLKDAYPVWQTTLQEIERRLGTENADTLRQKLVALS